MAEFDQQSADVKDFKTRLFLPRAKLPGVQMVLRELEKPNEEFPFIPNSWDLLLDCLQSPKREAWPTVPSVQLTFYSISDNSIFTDQDAWVVPCFAGRKINATKNWNEWKLLLLIMYWQ